MASHNDFSNIGKKQLLALAEKIKSGGIDDATREIIDFELNGPVEHPPFVKTPGVDFYSGDESLGWQAVSAVAAPYYRNLKSLDELLDRDERREEDGFKRKIHLGRVVKPSKDGSRKIVIVPTTSEDKFYHDSRISEDDDESGQGGGQGESQDGDTGEATGTAEGDEGDVIGERPLNQEGEGEGTGAGQGPGEGHEIGSSAYDLGKILTEKFKLPNLLDKGKKKSLTKYIYDLTDRNKGSGQLLDKKRTLREIIKTNIHLGRFDPEKPMKPEELLVNPQDYVYRTMSREKDVESQAVVFFVRDYSGSMYGKPTEIVCSQHVMIYSWLMYQYKEQVETRFVLHDTAAKEVPDFQVYHNSNVAGGTQVRSAFELINRIVEEEDLAKDYNIYVFYGGDGDDWNPDSKKFTAEFKKMFSYVNRLGITIVTHSYASGRKTNFEKFLRQNNILDNKKLVRLDVMNEDVEDKRIIEGIKTIISQDD